MFCKVPSFRYIFALKVIMLFIEMIYKSTISRLKIKIPPCGGINLPAGEAGSNQPILKHDTFQNWGLINN